MKPRHRDGLTLVRSGSAQEGPTRSVCGCRYGASAVATRNGTALNRPRQLALWAAGSRIHRHWEEPVSFNSIHNQLIRELVQAAKTL